ncbi:hypothetical protein MRY87_10750 [bacterium]|nr:hypothetical protein [bacterium]
MKNSHNFSEARAFAVSGAMRGSLFSNVVEVGGSGGFRFFLCFEGCFLMVTRRPGCFSFPFLVSSLILGVLFSSTVAAQAGPVLIERADGRELSKATGHWARARTYMVKALREFDRGTEVVDPDALIDAGELRSRILDHIQVLGRVIDPQPRATEGGVRYGAAPELLGETGGTVPPSAPPAASPAERYQDEAESRTESSEPLAASSAQNGEIEEYSAPAGQESEAREGEAPTGRERF